jgi:hypothetical protein
MGRWIFAGLVAIAVALGVIAYTNDGDWGDGDGWRRNDTEVVTTAQGETVIIERDRHFVPFFIFIPFLFIGLFWLLAGRRFGGGGGWPGNGRGQDWLNEWHRRQHGQSPGNA